MVPTVLLSIGGFLLLAGALSLGMLVVVQSRRRLFLEGLGKVVRIGTPCRVRAGRALLPGTVALTAQGIAWDSYPAAAGSPGSLTFEETQRLETDGRLLSGRRLFRNSVVRVTSTSGDVHEFVVSPGHAWEWRRALGEWTARQGRVG